jgi:hypothetical protein
MDQTTSQRAGNLEKHIINDLGKQLAHEMDQHVLIGFMLELGWHEVIVDPWKNPWQSEIEDWVKQTVQGHTMNSGNRWVFEDEKDATMFALKWG